MTTLFLPVPEALTELDRATRAYLGADGFWLGDDGMTPSMEHIADFSDLGLSNPQQAAVDLRAVLEQWPHDPSFAVELVAHDEGFDSQATYATGPVDLHVLQALAISRRCDWVRQHTSWLVGNGPPTDKPAAWLVLMTPTGDGQVTVWVSGEAEMDWGNADQTFARHYDLRDNDTLRACVSDLERELGIAADSGESNDG